MALKDKVEPFHPYVIEFWSRVDPPGASEDPLRLVLEEVGRFTYNGRNGNESLRTVLETGEGNCLAIAAALVSLLRGCPEGPVFSVIMPGFIKGFGHETNHVWVMSEASDGSLVLIDTANLRVTPPDTDYSDQSYLRFYCVFNEKGMKPGGSLDEVKALLRSEWSFFA